MHSVHVVSSVFRARAWTREDGCDGNGRRDLKFFNFDLFVKKNAIYL